MQKMSPTSDRKNAENELEFLSAEFDVTDRGKHVPLMISQRVILYRPINFQTIIST